MQQSLFYKYIVLTDKSYDFVRDVIAGKQMRFSKVQIGDGQVTDQNLEQLTGLINYIMDVNVSAVTRDGDQATVHIKFNSDAIVNAFLFREVGIYADIEGEEILFAYLNTGDKFEYLTPSSDGQVFTHKLQFAIGVGNAENVEIVFNDSSLGEGSITEEMLSQSTKDFITNQITGVTSTITTSVTALTTEVANINNKLLSVDGQISDLDSHVTSTKNSINNHLSAQITDVDGVHGLKYDKSTNALKYREGTGSWSTIDVGAGVGNEVTAHKNAKISDAEGVHGIKYVESEDALKITKTNGSTTSIKPGVDPDLLLSDLLTGLTNCINKVGS